MSQRLRATTSTTTEIRTTTTTVITTIIVASEPQTSSNIKASDATSFCSGISASDQILTQVDLSWSFEWKPTTQFRCTCPKTLGGDPPTLTTAFSLGMHRGVPIIEGDMLHPYESCHDVPIVCRCTNIDNGQTMTTDHNCDHIMTRQNDRINWLSIWSNDYIPVESSP